MDENVTKPAQETIPDRRSQRSQPEDQVRAASIKRMIQIGTIRTRLLAAFLAVVLLPMLVFSASAVFGIVQSSRQQLINQLESVVILKESEINTWLEDLQFDLVLAMTGDEVVQRASDLLQEPDPSDDRIGYSVLQTRFQQVIQYPGRFEELYLMDLEGMLILSTDPVQEGKIYADEVHFEQGLLGPYVQPPFFSLSQGETSVVAVRPVRNAQGETLGVLAGRANLSTLDAIMGERAGLGTTGETYLVGADYALLTQNRLGEREIPIRTSGANQAIANQTSGSDTYDNYRAVPVIGSYRWVPGLQVALLAEQEQAEAFQGVYVTLSILGGVALLFVLLAAGVSLLVTRGIATPLSNLATTASEIASGNLGQVAEIERDDEIGAVAQAFNAMTAQLRDLISSLEQRVADRTRELERRSHYLEAAAEVGRASASILESDALMQQVVNLIRDEFDLYYAGLFLLDDTGEWAMLQAGTGSGGRALLAKNHRLQVGGESMIGWCTAHGEARVALEAGEDAVRLATPELPETRSEAALPLRSRGKVVGALTVQDDEPGAFDADSIVVLQTMADQVAVALENARLFSDRAQALEMAQRAYGELSQEAWIALLQAQPHQGFRSDRHGLRPADDERWRPEAAEAVREGRTVVRGDSPGAKVPEPSPEADTGDGAGDEQVLAIPLRVRGEVIGVLDTYKPAEAGPWTAEEIALLERIVEEMDPALESARLYQDTQRRAAREQAIRQVTERMRRAVDVEAILQNTVVELARAMGAPRAYVRLGAPEPLGTESPGDGEGQGSGAGSVGSGRS